MVPDRLYVKSAAPTGKRRVVIKPRRFFNALLGPKVRFEAEIKVVQEWGNRYRNDTVEAFEWVPESEIQCKRWIEFDSSNMKLAA